MSGSGALTTANTSLGTVLVDSQGRTVYVFTKDTRDHSNCTGTCLSYWPMVSASSSQPSQVSGVSARIGAITRADGTKQLTVNGLPVYTYVGDTSPGMTSGQGSNGFGARWWVVSPSGQAITSSATSGSPSPSSSTSSSGGGARY